MQNAGGFVKNGSCFMQKREREYLVKKLSRID
jgi:hypothetical protein